MARDAPTRGMSRGLPPAAQLTGRARAASIRRLPGGNPAGGYLGRSPDHVASSMSGMMMGIEVFENYDPKRAQAFRDWFDYARKSDLFMTYVINNVQGDRSKAFGSQGKGAEDMVARIVDEDASGITIRGAKLFATSAIMASRQSRTNRMSGKKSSKANTSAPHAQTQSGW